MLVIPFLTQNGVSGRRYRRFTSKVGLHPADRPEREWSAPVKIPVGLRFPKTVQVAVFACARPCRRQPRKRLRGHRPGSGTDDRLFHVDQQFDPFDIVFFFHGMGYASHGDLPAAIYFFDYRNMLFLGCIRPCFRSSVSWVGRSKPVRRHRRVLLQQCFHKLRICTLASFFRPSVHSSVTLR